MNKILLLVIIAVSFTSMAARKFKVVFSSYNHDVSMVEYVYFPKSDIYSIEAKEAVCHIDSTGYDAEAEYGDMGLTIVDNKSNMASGGGYIKNGSGFTSISMNDWTCSVFEEE